MSKLKLAVVGSGWIAQLAHLPTWKQLDEVEVVAIVDVDEGKATGVAQKYGIKNVFIDILELLEKMPEVETVDICTPTNLHFPIAQASLLAGKHVIIEKPMATTSKDAEILCNLAKKQNKELLVAMNHRFRPDSMILKNFIKGKEIGDIFFAKAGWLKPKPEGLALKWQSSKSSAGGGVFMDTGIHILDLSWWLMGNPIPKTVSASIWKNGRPAKKNEIEDSVSAFLRFENGSTLNLETGWTFNIENDLIYTSLFGTEGSALLNPLRIFKRLHGKLVNVTPATENKTITSQNLFKKSYQYELGHFIQVILKKQETYSKPEDAIKRMKIIEAIYESGLTGKEIIL
ncbi:Gfo/Idh/MocA family oxidoreductase [bacterium]|nr:Gfo/Idh/MocA family oxidoreductase [bacterium]